MSPFAEHVSAHIFQCVSRNPRPLRQLVEHSHRDVELPDGTETRVSRRILRLAFPAFAPFAPLVKTGTASRSLRVATRAWWTP